MPNPPFLPTWSFKTISIVPDNKFLFQNYTAGQRVPTKGEVLFTCLSTTQITVGEPARKSPSMRCETAWENAGFSLASVCPFVSKHRNSSVRGLVYLRRKLRSVIQICHRISHESMRKHWTKSCINFAKWCDSTKYPDSLPRPAPSHRGSRNRSRRSLDNLRIWRRVRIKLSNYLHKKALWRRKERKSQSILNSNLNRRPCDVLCSLDTVVTTSSKCRNTQNLSRWKDKLLFAFMHGKYIVCHFLPSFPLFCCGQPY